MSRLAWVNIACLQCRTVFTTRPDNRELRDRFFEKFTKTEGCWIWKGSLDSYNYGFISRGGRGSGRIGAHRASWELHRGPITEGVQIDHLCRNRSCVNPEHLEPVTQQVNIARGFSPSAINARKTLCKRGHSLRDAIVGYKGKRRCRICNRLHAAAYKKTGKSTITTGLYEAATEVVK